MSYYIHNDGLGEVIVLTNDDNQIFFIPKDETNSDYQKYLSWLKEGNIPKLWAVNNGD